MIRFMLRLPLFSVKTHGSCAVCDIIVSARGRSGVLYT
jgi:hypothetical protein